MVKNPKFLFINILLYSAILTLLGCSSIKGSNNARPCTSQAEQTSKDAKIFEDSQNKAFAHIYTSPGYAVACTDSALHHVAWAVEAAVRTLQIAALDIDKVSKERTANLHQELLNSLTKISSKLVKDLDNCLKRSKGIDKIDNQGVDMRYWKKFNTSVEAYFNLEQPPKKRRIPNKLLKDCLELEKQLQGVDKVNHKNIKKEPLKFPFTIPKWQKSLDKVNENDIKRVEWELLTELKEAAISLAEISVSL